MRCQDTQINLVNCERQHLNIGSTHPLTFPVLASRSLFLETFLLPGFNSCSIDLLAGLVNSLTGYLGFFRSLDLYFSLCLFGVLSSRIIYSKSSSNL